MIKLLSKIDEGFPPRKYKPFGRNHHKINLCIEAPKETLDNIQFVEYLLHTNFKNRLRMSKERGTNFAIDIITWGTSPVDITIHYKDGGEFKFHSPMNLSK